MSFARPGRAVDDDVFLPPVFPEEADDPALFFRRAFVGVKGFAAVTLRDNGKTALFKLGVVFVIRVYFFPAPGAS
jgi:hypothetical protein